MLLEFPKKADKQSTSTSNGKGTSDDKKGRGSKTAAQIKESKKKGGKPSRRSSVAEHLKESIFLKEPASIMGPRLLFILSVVVLIIIGMVMVYSASSITAINDYGDAAYYVKKQGMFLVLGIVVCVGVAFAPYRVWCNPTVFFGLWIVSVLTLAATAFGLGVSALGAERSIMIAGFALQPAEFAKIIVLMAVGSLYSLWKEGQFEDKRFYIMLAISVFIPLILIYRQPDLGTAIILFIGILSMSIMVGLSWKIIGGLLGFLVAYVIFACITQPYHLDRIVTMFDPWLDPLGNGYQSVQSLYAFGSGGFFGTGLGLSRQKYLYLPYAHTDFIFAIVGEELGFVGAAFVVLVFGLFIFSGIQISRRANDVFGCLLSGSLTVMLGFQACVNMAAVCGIAPVTGKALPFLSYGGSSLMASLIVVGIVLSVSIHTKIDAENEERRNNLRVLDGGPAAVRTDLQSTAGGRVISLFGGTPVQPRTAARPRMEEREERPEHQTRGTGRRGSGRNESASRSRGRNESSQRRASGSSRQRGSESARGGRSGSRSSSSERSRSRNTSRDGSNRRGSGRGDVRGGSSRSSRTRGSSANNPNRSGRNRDRRR